MIDDPFARLGAELADSLEAVRSRAPSGSDAAARERFLRAQPSPRARLALLSAAATILLLVGLGLGRWASAQAPLGAALEGKVLTEGASVDANRPLVLRFTDGTELALEQGSRLRIEALRTAGATIRLHAGALEAAIEPSHGASWWLDAGPFRVHVRGTRFSLRWEPDQDHFTLALQEGSVAVEGPVVESGATLRPGQRLEVSIRERRAVLTDVGHEELWVLGLPAESLANPPPPSAAPNLEEEAPEPVSRQPKSQSDRRPPGPSEAVAGAPDASSLLRLADSERIAGRPDRAREALMALRRNYPGSPEAAVAAYTLGTLSFAAAPSQAVHWFRIYLQEAPKGSLSKEALGRLMEAEERAGRTAAARATAADYLKRYPKGPHADIATRLLSQ
jgi:TolA-binding protein